MTPASLPLATGRQPGIFRKKNPKFLIGIEFDQGLQGSKQRKFVREGFGGFKGCLEGIFGNPSLTQIPGKTKKSVRKYKKNLIKLTKN